MFHVKHREGGGASGGSLDGHRPHPLLHRRSGARGAAPLKYPGEPEEIEATADLN